MNRATLEAKLAKKCAKLYDARTPQATRRALSLEVSFLRARLSGQRDMLDTMTRASANTEEC